MHRSAALPILLALAACAAPPPATPAAAPAKVVSAGERDEDFAKRATRNGGVWGGGRLGRVPGACEGNATGCPTGAPPSVTDVADWMRTHLMAAVKPADGSPLRCVSCHADEAGRPVVKILGETRDRAKANEWMSLVMVRRFVAADGARLKCRSCHAGTPGTDAFDPRVIPRSERLPPHEVRP